MNPPEALMLWVLSIPYKHREFLPAFSDPSFPASQLPCLVLTSSWLTLERSSVVWPEFQARNPWRIGRCWLLCVERQNREEWELELQESCAGLNCAESRTCFHGVSIQR